ncbi:MAG TPA: rod shape-determining protein MreC, partial [Deinococcales bacterium]|nr:rod shape-determining protein MreC [Deinococcales bacterium]
ALSSGVAPLTSIIRRASLNLNAAVDSIVGQRQLAADNIRLRARNDELEGLSRRQAAYIKRLEQAAGVRETISPAIVAIAGVVAADPTPLLSRLVIDKGQADGVSERMPVVSGQNLVGVVMEVTKHSATVWTLIDPGLTVGVSIAGKGGRATAHGVAGGRLRADSFFPADLKVEPGDVVVTSNALGGIFPLVKVGTVEQVLPKGINTLGQTMFIKPAVNVNALETVYVLKTS